jgi:hypothetical protein
VLAVQHGFGENRDSFFINDFRGQNLYQRYGGGIGTGYGDAPVALHLYEANAGGKN